MPANTTELEKRLWDVSNGLRVNSRFYRHYLVRHLLNNLVSSWAVYGNKEMVCSIGTCTR
jgi:hypothetical protein